MLKKFLLILAIILCGSAYTQQLAFPGAEGFGKYTSGGRGGDVVEVTNLNDSGEGSFRAAIQKSGARTVIFKVSGTIYLQSALEIRNGDLTIAGQTAPGDGITLANYNFEVKADNVIIRYVRSRMGDKVNQEDDAFTCRGRKNIIIDHCSFSWGIDEVASTYENENFTMQWCIISESLYRSIHEKGDHGYGGIWGGSRATFHHNLIAHNSSRNPRFNGARYRSSPWEEIVDFRNNVIYNWGSNSAYGGDPSEIDGIKAGINIVGNYYKSGPATRTGKVQYRIVEPYDMLTYGYSYWYIDSNYVFGYPDVTSDNWTAGVQNVTETEKTAMRVNIPFDFDITTKHTAEEAYTRVLENSGAIIPTRDTIDKRIIRELETGTATFGGDAWGSGSGIIDTQSDVGGWPELFSATAAPDRDRDGMPDTWELANDLDPDDPEDRNDDKSGDGYTNLEYYLNSISFFPEFMRPPSSIQAVPGSNEINLSWTDNSHSETGIFIERREGNQDFHVIDTLPANAVSYTDAGLTSGQIYSYRLQTFNSMDTSLFSEVVTALVITGIHDFVNSSTIRFYPNPAMNVFHVSNSQENDWFRNIAIADLAGKTLISRSFGHGNQLVTIDINNLNRGHYLVMVNSTLTSFVGILAVTK